jgi:uncharacterized damage-inducible protein DinB
MPQIGRPETGEYAPYFDRYLSLIEGDDPLPPLAAQRAGFQALAGLSEERAGHRYAEGKWTVREVVGHVLDTERVFGYRALRVARGDQAPLSGFDENSFAQQASHDACALAELVEELVLVRRGHLLFFRHLPTDTWRRRGVANGNPVSTRALAFMMAGHAAHHLVLLRDRYGVSLP